MCVGRENHLAMTVVDDDAHGTAPSTPKGGFAFLRIGRGFWSGATARQAWLWSAAIATLLVYNLLVNLGFNRWNRYFYDALERKNGGELANASLLFVVLIVAGAAGAVAMTKARLTLQLRWRQWVTNHLLTKWFADETYYKLALTDSKATSPESRITDDVRLATEPVVDFATGFANALLQAVAFVSVLFVVGGSITIAGWTIPGYIAIAAVLYAVAVSTSTYLIGRPLTSAVDRKNEAEAEFRYGLTRVRQNVESIALIKGGNDELRRTQEGFSTLADRVSTVIRSQCHLTWVLNANAFFAGTFALLLAIPKYLTGDLTLGGLMQIGAAFTAVLSALNWFAENFITIAQWRASAQRVALLDTAMAELDFDATQSAAQDRLSVEEGSSNDLVLEGVSLSLPNGRVVVDDAHITIAAGERVLLGGESGTGKSTLIRAVAGLWPWGTGTVRLPAGGTVEFVPQRPYMPTGTLRDALAYPKPAAELDDDTARSILKLCGLAYFAEALDEPANLDQSLSGGERQRIAFARLMIQKPDIIVMDEATAALDVESEETLLRKLFDHLPQSTVLSVGHRPALAALHSRTILLRRETTGARVQPPGLSKRRIFDDGLQAIAKAGSDAVRTFRRPATSRFRARGYKSAANVARWVRRLRP